MGITMIGPYRLEAEIGIGGMGKVYRAVDERLERRVAIKQVCKPIAKRGLERKRLWREAKAIARLKHPSVVQIFDVVEEDGGDWIVMELVEGRTLASLIEDGLLELETALQVSCDVVEALAEAHEEGILHRDLKTENVMVTADGRTKLLDFGLAQPIAADAGDERLTIEGRIVGTPYSMSPEQAMSGVLDPRSDLFSLGTLIYEAFTGERPFRGPDLVSTLHRVCAAKHRPIRELNPRISSELARLVDRLLDKDPDRRPRDAGEVLRVLRRLPGRAAESRPAPSGTLTDEAVPRRRAPSSAPSAERRQLTVVHCELASGSFPSEELDPEELIELRPALHRLASEVAERRGGEVGDSFDQGLQLLFGYPRVQENDALRAVHAARDLVTKAGAIAGDGLVALTVGVHSGPAVVAGAGQLVLGETASIAAGLTRLAAPGAVLLSAVTREILTPSVRSEQQPPASIPGLSRPLVAHRLLDLSEADDTAWRPAVETPMVARQRELEILLDRWQLVSEGTGQVVLLTGEAGIGKSRLVQALRERLSGEPANWLFCRCSAIERNTPFSPVIAMLRRLVAADGGEPTLEALRAFVSRYLGSLPDALPLLASLMAIPSDPTLEDPAVDPGPQARRRRTLEALSTLFLERAEDQPTVLIGEDLHWVDPSTLELFELLADRAQGVPMLLLLTSRPKFQPRWSDASHTTQLTLGRLNRRQVADLIRQLAAEAPLAPSIAAVIAERTDGVPLFVEEVTKAVIESPESKETSSGAWRTATGSYLPVSVPATLQDLLAARLDRVGSAKAVAQLASALGRTFHLGLLAAVAGLSESQLRTELEVLAAAELVFRRGIGPRTRYTFKHALIQDAAYESLLRSERRRLHRTIAETIENRFSQMAEEAPQLLAHHYTEARAARAAIPLWLRAGNRAIDLSANAEAAAHLTRGLELVETLRASPERDLQELDCRLALGVALTRIKGAADQQIRDTYRRAEEISRRAGEARQRFSALHGLFRSQVTRGEIDRLRPLTERLKRLATESGDPAVEAQARQDLGAAMLYGGDFESARDHYRRSLAITPAGDFTENRIDGAVIRGSYLATALWYLGYPDQSLEQSRRARSRAEELGHPFSSAVAGILAAWLHTLRREPETTYEICEAALAVATEHQFGYFRILSQLELVAAQAAVGDSEPGLGSFRRALDAQQASRAVLGRTYFLGLLIESMRLAEHEPRETLAVVDETLVEIESRGERIMESEIRRHQGELLLALAAGGESEREQEAERCLLQALDVARRQKARPLELRTAASLARLWRDRGRREQAHELLAGVHGSFSEGFDTADLQAAKALIDELS